MDSTHQIQIFEWKFAGHCNLRTIGWISTKKHSKSIHTQQTFHSCIHFPENTMHRLWFNVSILDLIWWKFNWILKSWVQHPTSPPLPSYSNNPTIQKKPACHVRLTVWSIVCVSPSIHQTPHCKVWGDFELTLHQVATFQIHFSTTPRVFTQFQQMKIVFVSVLIKVLVFTFISAI